MPLRRSYRCLSHPRHGRNPEMLAVLHKKSRRFRFCCYRLRLRCGHLLLLRYRLRLRCGYMILLLLRFQKLILLLRLQQLTDQKGELMVRGALRWHRQEIVRS